MKLRRLLVPVVAGCAIFGLAAPAGASPPEMFSESGSFSEPGFVTETFTNSVTGTTVVNSGVFQQFFTRIDGTDEFTHTASGFDFQGKVDGRGPLVFQVVGRKVVVTDPETGEETVVVFHGHSTLPEGPEAEAVFCAAVS
jgi:hypothetical protein